MAPSFPISSGFGKIILPAILQSKKLRIPQTQVRIFGHELSDMAVIRLPNGRVWPVKLTKFGEKIWFDDGWQVFVESNSIDAYHFLIFKYKKNSTFDIIICDMTACEIVYPSSSDEESAIGEQSSEFEDETESEDYFQTSEDEQRHERRQCQKSKGKRKLDVDEAENDCGSSLWSVLQEMGMYITEKCELLTAEECKRAIKVTKSLKLKNPSFMIIFREREKCCRDMYVPKVFADKYVKGAKSIKVKNSGDSAESIQTRWRCKGGFFLSKGWTDFAKDKKLKYGDICVFELIGRKDFLFEFSVFRS